MNSNVKSLLKMNKLLHYSNSKSVILYIFMIIFSTINSLLINILYIEKLTVIAIIYIFFWNQIIINADYNMISIKNSEEFIKVMPISDNDYIKFKFIYGAYVLAKLNIVSLITLNIVIRNFITNNIYLIAFGLNIIVTALIIFKNIKSKEILQNKANKFEKKLSFLIALMAMVIIKMKYSSSYFLHKILSMNFLKLSENISCIVLLFVLINIIIYFVIMTFKLLEKEGD